MQGGHEREVSMEGERMREKPVSPSTGWLSRGKVLPNSRLDRQGSLYLPGPWGLSKEERLRKGRSRAKPKGRAEAASPLGRSWGLSAP